MIDYSDLDFVLVGPGKTGTFWLAQCLREHPDIFVTSETNFLTHYSYRGMDFWQRNFAGYQGERVVGEYANWYASFDGIPKKLFNLNPKLKIIFCLRHPIERVISFYKHDLRWGMLGRQISLQWAIQDDLFYQRYVYSARYSLHIDRFLKYFPPEQIYLFSSPGEGNDVGERLIELYNFLGANPIQPPSLHIRLNESRSPLIPLAHWYATFGSPGRLKRFCQAIDSLNIFLGSRLVVWEMNQEDLKALKTLVSPPEERRRLEEITAKYRLRGKLHLESWR